MAEPWRDLLSAWDEVSLAADEYRELDSKRILVLVDRTERGKRSGLEIVQMRADETHLLEIRDGQVIRLAQYFHRVGLEP